MIPSRTGPPSVPTERPIGTATGRTTGRSFARRSPHARPRSRRLAAILAAVGVLLLAGACGPLATADVPRFDYRRDATYAVPAGGALNVRWSLDLDAVGLTPGQVEETNLTWIPAGTRAESANVANRLVTLADPQVEDGWQVRLWQARLEREPAAGGYAYRLDVELRVDVPESAWDLTRRVSGRLAGRAGDGTSFTFLVRAE